MMSLIYSLVLLSKMLRKGLFEDRLLGEVTTMSVDLLLVDAGGYANAFEKQMILLIYSHCLTFKHVA